jgi:phosphoglycerate dehydrogenase-like enzyme
MKKLLVKIYLQILNILKPVDWKSGNSKILIYEPDPIRYKSFVEKINKSFPDYSGLTFKLVANKTDLIRYSFNADYIFSYGISKYLNISCVKTIYIGIVGFNRPDNLPDTVSLRTPANFAAPFIADFILSSVSAFERGLFKTDSLRLKKKWDQDIFFIRETKLISNLKIGILGLGNIGKLVLSHFSKLGCEIHAFDTINTDLPGVNFNYTKKNWPQLLALVDYLIIAIPDTQSNHFLIDTQMFELMSSKVCIVNVSRGNIIDENALISALSENRIRGAILDTFQKEPLPRKSMLWRLPNVVITPHISGNIQLVYHQIQNDFLNLLKSLQND